MTRSKTTRPKGEHSDPDRVNVVPRPQLHMRDQQIDDLASLCSAERIVLKFGGVKPLYEALRSVGDPVGRVQVYHWAKGKAYGVIPAKHVPYLEMAARLEGIVLTAADFDPRRQIEFD